MLNQSLNVISEKTHEKQESTEEKEREEELKQDASSAKIFKLNIIQKSSSMIQKSSSAKKDKKSIHMFDMTPFGYSSKDVSHEKPPRRHTQKNLKSPNQEKPEQNLININELERSLKTSMKTMKQNSEIGSIGSPRLFKSDDLHTVSDKPPKNPNFRNDIQH